MEYRVGFAIERMKQRGPIDFLITKLQSLRVRKNKPTRAGFAAELHCLYVLWGFNLLNGNFRWLVYNL
jgi:hypothetical protein